MMNDAGKRACHRMLDRILEQEGGTVVCIVYTTEEGLCVVWSDSDPRDVARVREDVIRLIEQTDGYETIDNHEQ
jgi:hypothetical protein